MWFSIGTTCGTTEVAKCHSLFIDHKGYSILNKSQKKPQPLGILATVMYSTEFWHRQNDKNKMLLIIQQKKIKNKNSENSTCLN
jgi:hypothetical protein